MSSSVTPVFGTHHGREETDAQISLARRRRGCQRPLSLVRAGKQAAANLFIMRWRPFNATLLPLSADRGSRFPCAANAAPDSAHRRAFVDFRRLPTCYEWRQHGLRCSLSVKSRATANSSLSTASQPEPGHFYPCHDPLQNSDWRVSVQSSVPLARSRPVTEHRRCRDRPRAPNSRQRNQPIKTKEYECAC